jgi:hypothetical protein
MLATVFGPEEPWQVEDPRVPADGAPRIAEAIQQRAASNGHLQGHVVVAGQQLEPAASVHERRKGVEHLGPGVRDPLDGAGRDRAPAPTGIRAGTADVRRKIEAVTEQNETLSAPASRPANERRERPAATLPLPVGGGQMQIADDQDLFARRVQVRGSSARIWAREARAGMTAS